MLAIQKTRCFNLINKLQLPDGKRTEECEKIHLQVLEVLSQDNWDVDRVETIFALLMQGALRDAEEYWVTVFECLIIASYQCASTILECIVRTIEGLSDYHKSACTIPALAGILRAVNWCDGREWDVKAKLRNEKLAAILPERVGQLLLIHAKSHGTHGSSEWLVCQFSSAFNAYIRGNGIVDGDHSSGRTLTVSKHLKHVGFAPDREIFAEIARAFLHNIELSARLRMFGEYFENEAAQREAIRRSYSSELKIYECAKE